MADADDPCCLVWFASFYLADDLFEIILWHLLGLDDEDEDEVEVEGGDGNEVDEDEDEDEDEVVVMQKLVILDPWLGNSSRQELIGNWH
ncbi:hypothetical protein TWF173_000747 [Orbilia oligospora]|nr:hypothetical protein TWF173_000747 [Orbilia oligospora]